MKKPTYLQWAWKFHKPKLILGPILLICSVLYWTFMSFQGSGWYLFFAILIGTVLSVASILISLYSWLIWIFVRDDQGYWQHYYDK